MTGGNDSTGAATKEQRRKTAQAAREALSEINAKAQAWTRDMSPAAADRVRAGATRKWEDRTKAGKKAHPGKSVSLAIKDETRKDSNGVRKSKREVLTKSGDTVTPNAERRSNGTLEEDAAIAALDAQKPGEVLKEDVREICERMYRESWGKSWDPALARWITGPAAHQLRDRDEKHAEVDAHAQEVVDQLRKALRRARKQIDMHPKSADGEISTHGVADAALCVSLDLIEGLSKRLDQCMDRPLIVSYPTKYAVQLFVFRAQTHPELFDLPRRPDVSEMTVMWLLAGGWKQSRKVRDQRPADVKKDVRQTVKAALDAVRKWARMA